MWLSSSLVYGQSYKTAFSLTGGIVDNGFGGLANFDYKTNDYDFVAISLQANFTNLEVNTIEVPVNLYGLNAGYFFDLMRNNSRVFTVALGGGGTVGYEVINEGDEILENNQRLDIDPSSVLFGVFAGIDLDVFLIPTVAINLRATETYHINSNLGEFTPYIGLGIKLILI